MPFAAGSLPAPGIFRRLAGMAYESLLLAGVLCIGLLLPHILLGAFAKLQAPPPVLWAHLILILLAYFVWFWCHGGQTLAMKTWRIRLQTAAGAPLTPGRALLRFALCWPSLALAGLGIAWALIDRDRQFLHDRLAGTRLIRL